MTTALIIFQLVLVLLVLGFIGTGWKDGFIHTLGRLVGAVIGFFLAKSWSLALANVLTIVMPFGWARFFGFLIVFLVVSRLVGYLFSFVETIFDLLSFIPFLKTINRILGGILGFVEGIFFLGASLWIVTHFQLIPSLASWAIAAPLSIWIQKIFTTMISLFPNALLN